MTVEAFGDRLRDEIDLETLSSELLAVVDQTVQPTKAALWATAIGPATATHRNLLVRR